jgi:hypothetical protein
MKHPQTGKPVKSRMEMPDWNPGFYLDVYPAVVPLWASPNGGDGAYKYSRPWAEFLRASNPQAYPSLEKISAGLFNPRSGEQEAFPPKLSNYDGNTVAEGVGATGNVYEVLEEKTGSVRVKLIDYQSTPPKPENLNYEDTPWLVTAFSAVAKDGSVKKTAGKDLVFPNLGKPNASGWVPKERVEFFPALPAQVSVRDWVNVRNGPGLTYTILGQLHAGNPATVTEYAPRGSNVWGKIGENRWIAIAHRTSNGSLYYYTTWKMETEPPLAFVHPRPYQLPRLPEPGEPQVPANDLVGKYFALLNAGKANEIAKMYTETSAKLVAEGRKFSGQDAIMNWHLRLLNNKLVDAQFKIVKVEKSGNFYEVNWTAHGKETDARNGVHMLRTESNSSERISYHYVEYDLV